MGKFSSQITQQV